MPVAENKVKADYDTSFTSVGSNEIPHYIDFRSFGYKENTTFYLLVYAVQTYNSKLEFLYPMVIGVVGKIEHVFTEIEGPAESNIVTQAFKKNNSNYLYYDFINSPVGDVASLKIINEGEVGVTISKVICGFVETGTTDEFMMGEINKIPRGGTNLCKGDEKKDSHGFNALINLSISSADLVQSIKTFLLSKESSYAFFSVFVVGCGFLGSSCVS